MVMTPEETIEELSRHYRAIIELIGEDASREGLVKTPMRAAKALYYATSGYREDAKALMREAVFEHHILPFFGKVSVGYIPDGEIIGLSKLARVVNVFARRLQVQERLTKEICKAVSESISTKGVMVVCEAEHLCMKMRGVEKQDSSTVTTDYIGAFEKDSSLRHEFYQLLASK